MSKSTWRLVDAMRLTKKKEQYNAIMVRVAHIRMKDRI